MKFIFQLFLILVFFEIKAQETPIFFLNKYPSSFKFYNKAHINYKSNPIAQKFKSKITSDYILAKKPDFASLFITSIWGCGTGCISGAMVDTRNGNVYEIPINLGHYNSNCFTENTSKLETRYYFNNNSKLFITAECHEITDKKTGKKILINTYYKYLWDDNKKKFILLP